jgi:pantoate kinase
LRSAATPLVRVDARRDPPGAGLHRTGTDFKIPAEAPRTVSPSSASHVAWAYAPGHVTGIFAPQLGARDPRARGSVGAGLVLEAGVIASAEWRASRRRSLEVRSDVLQPLPISTDVAHHLLSRRPGRLRVALTHELPIGQGFGMSAAGAVATALAVGAATGDTRRHELEVAHLADFYGGGGLGGVSAILAGGMEIRDRPGLPPWGHVRHYPTPGSLFVIVAGAAMPSPDLLGDPRFLRRVERAAGPGLGRLGRRPTFSNFLHEAERFTDALQLGPPPLLRRAHTLRSPDIRVAQAMFGRSLFAVPLTDRARARLIEELARLGLRAAEVPLARRGARILPGPPSPRRPLGE